MWCHLPLLLYYFMLNFTFKSWPSFSLNCFGFLCFIFFIKEKCWGFSRPLLHFKMLLLVSRKIQTCSYIWNQHILHKCFCPLEKLFLMFGLVWLGTGSWTLRTPPSRPWWGEPAKKSKVSPSHLSPSVADPGSGAFLIPGSEYCIQDKFFPDPGSPIPNPYFWEFSKNFG